MASAVPISQHVRNVVKGCKKYPFKAAALGNHMNCDQPLKLAPHHDIPVGQWPMENINSSVSSHVMSTWTPGNTKYNTPLITHGDGIYLFDAHGNRYIDWTSQAVCANLGHTVPECVIEATMKQMRELPYLYGGLGVSEIRARMSRLMAEIMPGDLEGMVFPSSGSEANEAAIMMARRYTGKFKVMSFYRSYHGCTGNALQATGDFRRATFGGDHVPGFVKMFNQFPIRWEHEGATEEEKCQNSLNMLEEQIQYEDPNTIACLTMEPVVGARGVIVPTTQYMQGVRALCDKYGILLHFDEVMTGFGRTGKLFAFQNFDGVIPDIVTAAKGMSSSFLPLSMTACREHIRQEFEDRALGWGSTYQAHPTALACAYENLKYLIREDVIGNVQRNQGRFDAYMKMLVENHPSIKQYRAIGYFGAFDIHKPDGSFPGPEDDAAFSIYRKAFTEQGLMALVRPPHCHVAPPLITTEEQLQDGFERQDNALYHLDDALGF